FLTHFFCVALAPFVIYYGNAGIRALGRRSTKAYEQQIKVLREEIDERVDQLKKKTAYDSPGSPGSPLASPLAGRGVSQPANGLAAMRNAQAASMGMAAPVPQPVFGQPVASGVVRTSQANMSAVRSESEPRPWLDKLVEGLVGETGPQEKYALICRHCFAHNGLVLPDEVNVIQYTCPKCGKFNPSRRALQEEEEGRGRRLSNGAGEFYSDDDGEPMVEEQVDYEYLEDDEMSPVRKSRHARKPRPESKSPVGVQLASDEDVEADDEKPSDEQQPKDDLPPEPETPTKPKKHTKRKGQAHAKGK
ncbi:hypothetical protein FBU59_005489, partial [Linderina macrospora]